MPTYQVLTDRSLASSTAITPTTLIHIVTTGDTSQGNPAGSSYKAELRQLNSIFSGSTFTGGSSNCISDFYVSNIHSCSPLNINPLDEGNVYFGSTSGVTIDIINSRIGVNNTNPSSNLHISGTTYFDTMGLTNSGVPSFRFLDGVSTPTETTTIKSIYKEFRPTTTSSNTVITDGTIIYPNVNSPTSAEFYASGNLNLFTGNLNNLTSIEALTAEVNVIQIQTNTGTYSGFVKSSSSVLRNLTNGGVVDKYVGFWMNGFDINFTHNGTTNNMYGFYMDSQSGMSGNIPPISNRWGVYIADNGRNYFAGNVGIGTTTPSEKLHVSGNTKIDGGLTANTISATTYLNLPTGYYNTTGITTSQSITWDKTYWGVSGSSNVDLILPTTTSKDGYSLIIKDEGGTAGTYRIRVTPTSGLIDGNTYIDMNINYMSLTFVARNNNWWII